MASIWNKLLVLYQDLKCGNIYFYTLYLYSLYFFQPKSKGQLYLEEYKGNKKIWPKVIVKYPFENVCSTLSPLISYYSILTTLDTKNKKLSGEKQAGLQEIANLAKSFHG